MFRFHPLPDGEPAYGGYSVTLNGKPAPLAVARVSAMPYNTIWPGRQRPLDQTELLGFASFEADEEVTVAVTYGKPVKKAVVRPLSKGVEAKIDGNVVTFTLRTPGQYFCEADGYHNALSLFFDPVTDYESRATGKILRYPAGIHRIGNVMLESDTTVILEDGAYIYGSFTAICAENVRIFGHGVIDGSSEERFTGCKMFPPYDFHYRMPDSKEGILNFLKEKKVLNGLVRFYRCRNCELNGPILRDSATFCVIPAACDNIVIDRIKLIGMWRYNSDGVDVFNSANIVLRNSFLRNFDDCVVLKGIKGWDERNLENILVENCVVWCDWGRNLEIGAETNAPEYRNIIFRNCDNIHGDLILLDLHHHNRAEIHHLLFEDIRCEFEERHLPNTYQHDMNAPFDWNQKTVQPQLIAMPIYDDGMFSDDGLNGSIHDIVYKDIKILNETDSMPKPVIFMKGLDENHLVEHIRFENMTINGKPAKESDFEVVSDKFVRDVIFK